MNEKERMRMLMNQVEAEMSGKKISEIAPNGKTKLMEEWPHDFVDEVSMTREEWLEVNRALSGAALGLQFTRDPKGRDRLASIKEAQQILSDIHRRANPE